MSRSCIQKSTCIFAITSLFLLYMAFGHTTSVHASSLTPGRANLPQSHQDYPMGSKGSPRALSICSTFIILAVDGKNSTNMTVNVNRDFELELEKNANCILKISGKGYHHHHHHGMMKRGGWMKSDPSDMSEQSSSMSDASQATEASAPTAPSAPNTASNAPSTTYSPEMNAPAITSVTPNQ
ncbi:hypothetical protein [Ktedonobacter racemifer]|uniref:Uncharacterized protein n=1 Tax=Ktedonobacter racemifer DSM 44963 TaxID=485913 RepID=D6TEU5_KTERA|nr:hypothetical protein [Ktedonobacter racemifer]EFH88544.1 hypothetical protein Krac_10019 [Ktedonobacter racemifer DSM 44963]